MLYLSTANFCNVKTKQQTKTYRATNCTHEDMAFHMQINEGVSSAQETPLIPKQHVSQAAKTQDARQHVLSGLPATLCQN